MADLSDMIHGKKPQVAEFLPTDPIEMLGKLLRGEITQWPSIAELGNLFQSDVFQKLQNAGLDLKSLISLGGENAQQTGLNALALQQGQLPPEVTNALFRTSAMQNIQSGLFGSGAGTANQLRQLGIGVLQGQQQGAQLAGEAGNAAQRWAQIAQGTMLPANTQLYSPEWFTEFDAKQKAAKQATLQFKYNTEAAPDPAWADRAKMFASLLGSFAGPGGASMGQYASGSYGQNFGGATGGTTGGTLAAGYGQQSQNPGFFSNFGTAYNSPDPNYQTQGAGGALGGWLGGMFNQG